MRAVQENIKPRSPKHLRKTISDQPFDLKHSPVDQCKLDLLNPSNSKYCFRPCSYGVISASEKTLFQQVYKRDLACYENNMKSYTAFI